MGKYRVLIADDRPGLTERITAMLPNQFEVLASLQTTDRAPLRRAALKREPDVILIGTAVPNQDIFQTIQEIIRILPQARIVFNAIKDGGHPESYHEVASVLSACDLARAAACEAVAMAEAEQSDAAITAAGQKSPTPDGSPSGRLTDRENEVLGLLAAGYPMKRIAHRLGITYRTVTFHKYRMMEKLGIGTNAGLVTYALERNIFEHIEPDETAVAA